MHKYGKQNYILMNKIFHVIPWKTLVNFGHCLKVWDIQVHLTEMMNVLIVQNEFSLFYIKKKKQANVIFLQYTQYWAF